MTISGPSIPPNLSACAQLLSFEIEYLTPESFSNLKSHSGHGENHKLLETAFLNGRKVFVKVLLIGSNETNGTFFSELADDTDVTHRTASTASQISDFKNEVDWTKRLSDLGIGPHFHGLMITKTGNIAIVTDFAEGTMVKPSQISYDGISELSLRPQLLDSLIHIRDRLNAEHIVANDLHVIISRENATVIDPARFALESPEGALLRSKGLLNSQMAGMKRLIEYVRYKLEP